MLKIFTYILKLTICHRCQVPKPFKLDYLQVSHCHLISPFLCIYNVPTAPMPTLEPSKSPTPTPLFRSCSWDYQLDLIMIVDTSCGLNDDEQEMQQQFISDLVQLTKKNANPRLGLIECNQHYVHQSDMIAISLGDNTVNGDDDPTHHQINELYSDIKNRRTYTEEGFTTTPKKLCMETALHQFAQYGDSGINQRGRKRKVVMMSNCGEKGL